MKRVKTILVVALAVALLFTSCNKGKSESTVAQSATKIQGTMKIVATSESYKTLFDKFTAETGIKTEMLSMSSGEVLSKLRAEGSKSSADLWFGGGIDAFMSAKNDGLLRQVNFDASSRIDSRYKDSDNYYFSKGLTIVGFLVNNKIAKEKKLPLPENWDDLIKPVYKGEIIMSNPAISGTNYAALNALLQTKGDKGWDYFRALNNNIAYYARRGSDPKNKVIADEFAIGITYLDGTIDALLDDYDVTIVYPKDGIPFMPDGVAAFANSDNGDAAALFIEWLYSNDENMQLLAKIDQKTSIKVIVPDLKGVDLDYSTDILMKEDLARFGSEREQVLSIFDSIAQSKTT